MHEHIRHSLPHKHGTNTDFTNQATKDTVGKCSAPLCIREEITTLQQKGLVLTSEEATTTITHDSEHSCTGKLRMKI